jgi:hypothetical protein
MPVQTNTSLFNKNNFDHICTASNFDNGTQNHGFWDRFFEADVMVGTRRPGTGQNMKIYEKRIQLRNVHKYQNLPTMCRIPIFLDETGCILNEKMMPDLTAMVPELKLERKLWTIYISKEKCENPGMRVLTRMVGGITGDGINFAS